jgi:hypothetical protein
MTWTRIPMRCWYPTAHEDGGWERGYGTTCAGIHPQQPISWGDICPSSPHPLSSATSRIGILTHPAIRHPHPAGHPHPSWLLDGPSRHQARIHAPPPRPISGILLYPRSECAVFALSAASKIYEALSQDRRLRTASRRSQRLRFVKAKSWNSRPLQNRGFSMVAGGGVFVKGQNPASDTGHTRIRHGAIQMRPQG